MVPRTMTSTAPWGYQNSRVCGIHRNSYLDALTCKPKDRQRGEFRTSCSRKCESRDERGTYTSILYGMAVAISPTGRMKMVPTLIPILNERVNPCGYKTTL